MTWGLARPALKFSGVCNVTSKHLIPSNQLSPSRQAIQSLQQHPPTLQLTHRSLLHLPIACQPLARWVSKPTNRDKEWTHSSQDSKRVRIPPTLPTLYLHPSFTEPFPQSLKSFASRNAMPNEHTAPPTEVAPYTATANMCAPRAGKTSPSAKRKPGRRRE